MSAMSLRVKRLFTVPVLVAMFVLCAAGSVFAYDYIWWEGEGFTTSNWPSGTVISSWPSWSGWWRPDPGNEIRLSEGVWINTSSQPSVILWAEYQVSVPTTGQYRLYARKFWH